MKTQQQSTPGPWEFIPNRIIGRIDGQAVEVCAIGQYDLLDTKEAEQIEANARLITAAPDLLQALQSLVEALKHHDYTHEGCTVCADVRAARATIALATGQTQTEV